jgi:hypothetical protein
MGLWIRDTRLFILWNAHLTVTKRRRKELLSASQVLVAVASRNRRLGWRFCEKNEVETICKWNLLRVSLYQEYKKVYPFVPRVQKGKLVSVFITTDVQSVHMRSFAILYFRCSCHSIITHNLLIIQLLTQFIISIYNTALSCEFLKGQANEQ